jgi:hypothetical protein
VHDAPVQDGSAHHRFAIRRIYHAPHELLELGREPGEGALAVSVTVANGDVGGVGTAQLCGLFDNGLQDLVEVESETRDRCKRSTEGRKSGGFALLFCFDRTIPVAWGTFDPLRPGSGSRGR